MTHRLLSPPFRLLLPAIAGLGCGLALAAGPQVAAQDAANWPNWRGPLANGVAPGGNPPLRWSETENVRWKVKIPGKGSSTPVIWGDRLFLQTALSTGKKVDAPAAPDTAQRGFGRGLQPTEVHQFVLLCLDRKTGRTLWQSVCREELPHEGHHQDHGFSSYSPVTDGEVVVASFGSRGIHCFDLQGKRLWEKDLGKMRTRNGFGEGSSPAMAGEVVVINWDHEGEDFIVGLDRKTGRELWRQPREEATSWATPLIVKHDGKFQVVTPGTTRMRTYDLTTGKLLWEHAGLTANVIPTPVAAGDVVYAMSGFRGNQLYAIRLGGSGDLTGTPSVLWSHKRNTPYVPSPLLYGERLYFFSGNTGILSCFNARTGAPLIDAERLDALVGVYASPVGAAGRVYLLGRTGGAVVIKDGDKLEVLATNKLDDRFDASPAVVGSEMYLRGHQYLYCVAEK